MTGAVQFNLLRKLNDLQSMELPELIAEYEALVGRKPLTDCVPVLRRALAYRLQAQVHGDLEEGEKAHLRRLAALPKPDRPLIMPGTKLVRTWHGTDYVVTARDDGWFDFNGRAWRSLTAIANRITGTKWSGHAFFGLRKE